MSCSDCWPKRSFLSLALGTPTRSCLPIVKSDEEDEVVTLGEDEAQENWIYIEHRRPGPGDLDPATRKPSKESPVLSTARIYEAGTTKEIAKAKITANGKPVRVAVPVDISSFDVVFEDDFGGAYEVTHKPYPNPFTDTTEVPTEAQIARMGSIRLG